MLNLMNIVQKVVTDIMQTHKHIYIFYTYINTQRPGTLRKYVPRNIRIGNHFLVRDLNGYMHHVYTTSSIFIWLFTITIKVDKAAQIVRQINYVNQKESNKNICAESTILFSLKFKTQRGLTFFLQRTINCLQLRSGCCCRWLSGLLTNCYTSQSLRFIKHFVFIDFALFLYIIHKHEKYGQRNGFLLNTIYA